MSLPDMLNDEQLISGLKDGDPSALGLLHDLHYKKLYSIALRITGSREDAQDAVQDAFFQLWRKCSQFDSNRGSLIGWLLTITRHRAIERIRERRGLDYSADVLDETALNPVAELTALDREIARQLISLASINLTEAQRTAITLAYFEGFTLEEIARRTQTPLGTVKQRVRCGLESMKKSLIRSPRRNSKRQTTFPALLADIVITEQLQYRPCRARDLGQEANSLRKLNELAADSTDHLIDFFIQLPIDLCRADSGGLSLLETSSDGEQIFRWTHISGTLAKYVGGHTPRNFSPCGVTLDAGAPQLFRNQARYFHYFNEVAVPIVEVLVIPFIVGNKTEGTIWIASHHEEIEFDSEDVRIMTSIAEFVGSAIHLSKSLPRLFGRQNCQSEPI